MEGLVVKTCFIPPQLKKRFYQCTSLLNKLESGSNSYPLTIVQAGL